jgi:hypothetical protein
MGEGEPNSPTWKFTQSVLSAFFLLLRTLPIPIHWWYPKHDLRSSFFYLGSAPRGHINTANLEIRCFGDKGDVEDITEGQCLLNHVGWAVCLAAAPVFQAIFVFSRTKANALWFIADIISTVEFDHTGNYLATGDKGGRVVLFERNETV